ncbi:hypothetical protein EDD91_7355 [Streptomyces sp. KS 21]|nr:hypothetical protein EDD91_7355 [Streptomyces sp. KS 21]
MHSATKIPTGTVVKLQFNGQRLRSMRRSLADLHQPRRCFLGSGEVDLLELPRHDRAPAGMRYTYCIPFLNPGCSWSLHSGFPGSLYRSLIASYRRPWSSISEFATGQPHVRSMLAFRTAERRWV